jgi:hypothetical protein
MKLFSSDELHPFAAGVLATIIAAVMFLTLAAFLAPTPVTWYIRPTDGGTPAQCTGQTNAPYPGTGTAQACAYSTIFYMVTNNTSSAAFSWRSAAGDIIQYGEMATPDVIGLRLGSGIGLVLQKCSGDAPDCDLPPPPNSTHLWGVNKGNCNDPFVSANRWLGINGVFFMFNVAGTSNVDVQCILMTQPDDCTHVSISARCVFGTNNYGQHGFHLADGTNQGPINLLIKDVAIVGLSSQCMLGSHINSSSGDTTTLTNVYMWGCGLAGWDWDSGVSGTNQQSVGTVTMQVDVRYSGCVIVMPFTTQASVKADHCAGESTGGYGDGLGIGVPSLHLNLIIHDSFFMYNVQDGPDTLHMGDLPSNTSSQTLLRNTSIGNGGQIFKQGAVLNSTQINNFAWGDCAVMVQNTVAPMSTWPSSYLTNLSSGDLCRAGDQWTINIQNGGTYIFNHNTTVGYNGVAWDFECASGVTSCDVGVVVVFENNLNIAYANGGPFAAGLFLNGIADVFAHTGSILAHNSWFNYRNGCQQDSVETSFICTNPTLTNQLINSINPIPLSGSPVIGAGITTSTTTDLDNNAFSSPPSIGAIEAGSAPPTPTLVSIAVTPSPGAVLVGSNLAMTCTATLSDGTHPACTSPVWTDTAAHSSVNSSTGIVTGTSGGSDTIRATIGSVSGSATVNIAIPSPSHLIIQGVTGIGFLMGLL